MLHKSHYVLILTLCLPLCASQVALVKVQDKVKQLYGEIGKPHPSLERIKKLIDSGVSVDAPCEEWTPLLYAIRKGHLELCKALVGRGANINQVFPSSGASALHYASACKQAEIALYLLEQNGINPHVVDNKNATPLHYAAKEGLKDICEQLITTHQLNRLTRCYGGNTFLHLAIFGGHDELACYFIEKDVPVTATNDKGETALHFAAKRNNAELVHELKKSSALIDAKTSDGQTPLHYAAERDCLKSGEALLGLGAQCDIFDDKGQTAFDKAIFSFHTDFCFVLLNYMATFPPFQENKMTALHRAAQYESPELCKAMLLKIGNVDPINEKGETPLMFAARRSDNTSIVSLFLNKGASVFHTSTDGTTPLHYAAMINSVELCEQLLTKGAVFLSH